LVLFLLAVEKNRRLGKSILAISDDPVSRDLVSPIQEERTLVPIGPVVSTSGTHDFRRFVLFLHDSSIVGCSGTGTSTASSHLAKITLCRLLHIWDTVADRMGCIFVFESMISGFSCSYGTPKCSCRRSTFGVQRRISIES
jgi:hypothetical protein